MQFGGEPEQRTSDQIPDQSGVGRSPGCIVSVHRPSSEVRGLTDTTSNAAEGGCCAACGRPVAAIRTSSRPRRDIAPSDADVALFGPACYCFVAVKLTSFCLEPEPTENLARPLMMLPLASSVPVNR